MPGFFSRFGNSAPSFSSSSAHRHAQRTLAGAGLIAAKLLPLDVSTIITTKFTQALISGYSAVCKDMHDCEKLLHGLQGLLALAQTGIAISLFLTNEKCEDKSQMLCQLLYVLDMLYTAVVIAGWLPSEFSKDEKPSAETAGLLSDETDNESSSLSA